MTEAEARSKIAVHAGKHDDFSDGYVYALKYGFQSISELQQKFDDIFTCLKKLKTAFYNNAIERELLADVSEILYASILYVNSQKTAGHVVRIFSEVLSETLVYLLENTEYPFEAFDHYAENYDDVLNIEKNQS